MKLRNHLQRCAGIGELTPAEVERIGADCGLEPFSHLPNDDDFDPRLEPYWTLGMSIAWISLRTLADVRDMWARYTEKCWDWRWSEFRRGPGYGLDGSESYVHRGWFLEQRKTPSFVRMAVVQAMAQTEGTKSPMTVTEATDALRRALREGHLEATGLSSEGGQREEIRSIDWHELTFVEGRHEMDEARRGATGSGYSDVLLPSAALLRMWPQARPRIDRLPALIAPIGDGYIPLYCAAQWIATEGGARDFDPDDLAIWRIAFDQLLGAIASERIRVVGMRSGMKEFVPELHFAGCFVDYPVSGAPPISLVGDTVYLRSHPYIDEDSWRAGHDDALVSRQSDYWTQLMVEKHGVLERWPFGHSVPRITGAPGRPTSMHLIIAELRRRAAEGKLNESIVEESRDLARWLAATHQHVPQPKPKAIETGIRPLYRELRARK